jgi:hypothetical protein
MCILNYTSHTEDVERVLDFFATAEPRAVEIRPLERDRTVSFLDVLPPDATARGVVEEAEAGATIVAQWDLSRNFYVLLDGSVEVSANGRQLAVLHPGAFFGSSPPSTGARATATRDSRASQRQRPSGCSCSRPRCSPSSCASIRASPH